MNKNHETTVLLVIYNEWKLERMPLSSEEWASMLVYLEKEGYITSNRKLTESGRNKVREIGGHARSVLLNTLYNHK